MASAEWPEYLQAKVIVLDFDKTITNKHTRGAVFQTSGLEPDELRKNFADLEFFKKIVPIICQHATLAIATFADDDEESLLSGKALVRSYLDVAFDNNSAKFIPDENIEAWNPENREMDMKVAGKQHHLEALRKRIAKGIKKSQIVLFDDSERNVALAKKSGYGTVQVEAAKNKEEEAAATDKPTGFCKACWDGYLEAEKNKKEGGCVMC